MPKEGGRSMSLTSQESYSAVIIADMVANVPIDPSEAANWEARRRGSAPKSPKKTQKEANYVYDGPLDSVADEPATVNVDSMETVHMRPTRINGTENGVSKGVILNASLISPSYDTKGKSDQGVGSKTLSLKMSEAPLSSTSPELKEELAEMSVMRKIAFAFSFIPSIMFVLCFAVILPCDEVKPGPCVHEAWSTTLNHTELTSQLNFPDDLIFAYSNEDGKGIASFNRNNGTESWKAILNSEIRYINCDSLDFNNDTVYDCLIMDKTGNLRVYNTSDGKVLWDLNLTLLDQVLSLPTLLPDCNDDSVAEVVVAVSNTQIKVVYGGYTITKIPVSDCATVPSRLMAWSRNGTTDLVFHCETEDGGTVIQKMPQSTWCLYDNGQDSDTIPLLKRNESLEQALILPTEEGLAIWNEDDVFMIDADGAQSWKVSSTNHSTKRRFLKYGRFNDKGNQVALFSSDILENLQVTMLNSTDGNEIWSWLIPNAEVSDVQLLSGKDKDFVLLAIIKIKNDLTTEAVTRLNGVTSTIVSFLSNDEVNTTAYNLQTMSGSKCVQEIALMMLYDKVPQLTLYEKELPCSLDEEEGTTNSMTALAFNANGNSLTIIAASSLKSLPSMQATLQLTATTVENWDISTSHESKCNW